MRRLPLGAGEARRRGEGMRGWRWIGLAVVVLLGSGRLQAEDIGCVSTTFRVLGANDKICVSAFDDPKVPGVTCHLSQAYWRDERDDRRGEIHPLPSRVSAGRSDHRGSHEAAQRG